MKDWEKELKRRFIRLANKMGWLEVTSDNFDDEMPFSMLDCYEKSRNLIRTLLEEERKEWFKSVLNRRMIQDSVKAQCADELEEIKLEELVDHKPQSNHCLVYKICNGISWEIDVMLANTINYKIDNLIKKWRGK